MDQVKRVGAFDGDSESREWKRVCELANATRLAANGCFADGRGIGRIDARGRAAIANSRWNEAVTKGLNWLSRTQSSRGQWNTQVYPTALAALAGTALISSGSTTTQGPYAKEIARASDYLISKSRDNGLIGDPQDRFSLHLWARLLDAHALASAGRRGLAGSTRRTC